MAFRCTQKQEKGSFVEKKTESVTSLTKEINCVNNHWHVTMQKERRTETCLVITKYHTSKAEGRRVTLPGKAGRDRDTSGTVQSAWIDDLTGTTFPNKLPTKTAKVELSRYFSLSLLLLLNLKAPPTRTGGEI